MGDDSEDSFGVVGATEGEAPPKPPEKPAGTNGGDGAAPERRTSQQFPKEGIVLPRTNSMESEDGKIVEIKPGSLDGAKPIEGTPGSNPAEFEFEDDEDSVDLSSLTSQSSEEYRRMEGGIVVCYWKLGYFRKFSKKSSRTKQQ